MKERPKRRRQAPASVSYSREVADRICRELGDGKALVTICQEIGVAKQDVYEWVIDNHDGFADRYARARHVMALGWADELMHIADDRSRDFRVDEDGKMVPDYDTISRSRIRIDTRKWILGKLLPKVYGDKIVTELTGKDGAALEAPSTTINILALPPEQRDQLKAILLQATKGKADDDT